MEFQDWVESFARFPWVLFLAIAILPGLGVPNCPMLILCGTIMTAAFGVPEAIGLAVAAVIVNILWTWWAAAYPLRSFLMDRVEPRVAQHVKSHFQMSEKNVLAITFFLHVMPGVPLFIQNYFPGVHRLSYWKYLAIAIPIQSLYTALIVGTSGQIFDSLKAYPLVLSGVILFIWIGIKIYRRNRTKSPAV